jgi:hypothetical protein
MQLYVPPDPAPWRPRDAAVFFACAFVALLLFVACLRAARPRSDTVGFVLAPGLCLALLYENVALGAAALAQVDLDGAPDSSTVTVAASMLQLRGAVQAFVIPLWLAALFEITYTVHKRRSANFLLGLFTFDQGHRRSHSLLANAVRYAMWVAGVATLLMQITVNAPYTAAPLTAPRAARFSYKGMALSGRADGAAFDWQDAVDFIPWLGFLLWALIAGASLWRYGSLISTDINATMVNTWGCVFWGAVALSLAWVFSPKSWAFPYATNPAELLLLAALVRTMGLVESNLRTLDGWDRVLTLAGEAIVAALEQKRWAAERAAGAAAGGGGGSGGGASGGAGAQPALLARRLPPAQRRAPPLPPTKEDIMEGGGAAVSDGAPSPASASSPKKLRGIALPASAARRKVEAQTRPAADAVGPPRTLSPRSARLADLARRGVGGSRQ